MMKIRGSYIVQQKRFRTHTPIKRESMQSLFQKYKNIRGFVIGGGTSLLQVKESQELKRKLQKEITIGTCMAYELFSPTYLVFIDSYFWKKWGKEVQKLQCKKIVPADILGGSNYSNFISLQREKKNNILPESSDEIFYFGNNSGVAGLRIAYYLGLNPIYLLGIDLRMGDKNRGHFHEKYFIKSSQGVIKSSERVPSMKQYSRYKLDFLTTIEQLKHKKIEVISCSSISLLNDTIPYKDIQDIL